MSKIELTDAQVNDLYMSGHDGECLGESYESMLNMAIKLGLVRPASDDPMQREWEDVKARVAALEAKVNAPPAHGWGKADPTPDPHAAAKDEEAPKLHPIDNRSVFRKAWDETAEPRTEADRLGEVAYNEYFADDEVCSWEECHDNTRGLWSTIAHAVRKAVIEGQLEPSEEEVLAGAVELFLQEGRLAECWDNADEGSQKEWLHESRSVLKAAARVRLAKAEGEDK